MKFSLGMQRKIKILYKLILPFGCAYPDMDQNKFAYLYNISMKNMELRWFFCLQINTKVFCKVIVFWVCVTRLAQGTRNNKFAISLQYLKKNGKNEVDFLLVDKHQRFLEIAAIILGVCGQACPSYPKKQISYFFAVS